MINFIRGFFRKKRIKWKRREGRPPRNRIRGV